jgi:hypothetical protein
MVTLTYNLSYFVGIIRGLWFKAVQEKFSETLSQEISQENKMEEEGEEDKEKEEEEEKEKRVDTGSLKQSCSYMR